MTEPTTLGRRAGQPSGGTRMEPMVCPVRHDWSRYSLGQIAAMFQSQPPTAGPAAVNAWTAIETLCREQADRLRKALQALAVRWPTSQQAALAFQEWGKSLVQAMETTADTASWNRQVAANISEEIDRARARINALLGEWASYQRIEQSRGFLVAEATHVGIELLDGEVSLSGWRADLNRQAREVMASLEQKIYNYTSNLYADEPYNPPVGPPKDMLDLNGNDLGVAGSWGGGGFASSVGGWPGGWTPPSSVIGAGWNPLDGLPGETVLDGAGPTVSSAAPVANGPAAGGALVDTPWGRVLAPGGVIGAPGGLGTGAGTMPSGPGLTTNPATAGLPPGTGQAPRPTTSPGVVPFMPPVMPGRATSNPASTTSNRRSRPGLPSVFETPDGPPGVIQPPPEPTHHDPGPGVIGIDR